MNITNVTLYRKINKPAYELTVTELQEEYCYQYKRTNGLSIALEYNHGWFDLDNGRSKYRAHELRAMTERLRERPTKIEA